MVDIDKDVVEVSKKYLPAWHDGAFDDPRTVLLHQDARDYLKNTDSRFDLIIIDLSDPVEGNPSALLFTKQFYQMAQEHLAPDGVLVLQAETVDYGRTKAFTAICHTLGEVFKRVFPYHVGVPSFSGDWGFAMATQGLDPTLLSPSEVDMTLTQRLSRSARAYDGLTHQGIFLLPRLLREQLEAETQVLTESDFLVVP